MAIKLFVAISLVLSTLFLFVKNEDNSSKYLRNNNNALITFYDSTMFTFNEQYVTQYVKSSLANRFKSRDELDDATIILRNKSKNANSIDIITAKKIVVKNELFEFYKDVHLNRTGEFVVVSDKMFYDRSKKIAYNDTTFNGTYNSSKFNGKNLYLKQDEKFIKADDINFEIEIANKGKK